MSGQQINAAASELTEQDVADALGKSRRWVQQWLADDARSASPCGQFHHYIGASRRWTEQNFQKLREAVLQKSAAKRGVVSNAVRSTDSGGCTVHYDLTDGRTAYEKVLALPLTGRNTKRKRPAPNSKGKPSRNLSLESGKVVTLER